MEVEGEKQKDLKDKVGKKLKTSRKVQISVVPFLISFIPLRVEFD